MIESVAGIFKWLCEDVLKGVPHRHFVFSVPKFLRRYFLYDRKLLSDLSRCGWESLKKFFTAVVPEKDSLPGAVIAVQTFGDFLGFHPHLHILCSDGCFYGDGMFQVSPLFELKHLEDIFKHKVFKMLLSKEKKILKHLGLWEREARPPPKIEKPTKVAETIIDYSHRGVGPYGPEADSQVPLSDEYLYYDVEYPVEDPGLSGEVSII